MPFRDETRIGGTILRQTSYTGSGGDKSFEETREVAGKNWPTVDHAAARLHALDAHASLKKDG
ncbi:MULTISPECIES: hypothetical protein [unclassified Rhizobium]|uniref:hypothetical protein n=1 Tax=unclassified Rhizobium TaxID=2613769 RepID=UPI000EB744CD|nr:MULTISPECIES: hypothetical protein [unclassified Rhizobium]AYG65994.1 hypothetical protein CCGE531_08280 [Rhizobium sp. CCGE531]